jgi:hypothetical protein
MKRMWCREDRAAATAHRRARRCNTSMGWGPRRALMCTTPGGLAATVRGRRPPNSKSRMEEDPSPAYVYASCLCISSPGTLSAAGAPPRHHLHYHLPRAAGVNSAAQAGGGHHMCSQDCLLRLSSCSWRQYFKSPSNQT